MNLQQPQIDMNSLETVSCKTCRSEEFVIVYSLKKIPASLSDNGFEQIMPIFKHLECSVCGEKINIEV